MKTEDTPTHGSRDPLGSPSSSALESEWSMAEPELCRLCKASDDFNFEHLPPASTWNDDRVIAKDPKRQLLIEPWNAEPDGRGRQEQRGLGGRFLCKRCNNFTGREYVPAYGTFVKQVVSAPSGRIVKGVQFRPLAVLKQLVTMAIALTDNGPEWDRVRAFVLDPKSNDFPGGYRLFVFRCSGTLGRLYGGWQQIVIPSRRLHVGLVEVAVRPFGFQLRYGDALDDTDRMLDVTGWASFSIGSVATGEFGFHELPIVSPMYNDFRSSQELQLPPEQAAERARRAEAFAKWQALRRRQNRR